MMRLMFVLVGLLAVAQATVQADSPRRHRYRQTMMSEMPQATSVPQQQEVVTATTHVEPSKTSTSTPSVTGSEDALSEVNAERARRGLKPFLPDPLLNQAALACAKQRASRHIHGHLPESDFHYLPAGARSNAAGCGALEPSWGWGTCCTYDNYTYAGAAWVMGNDGRRYMHLFVR